MQLKGWQVLIRGKTRVSPEQSPGRTLCRCSLVSMTTLLISSLPKLHPGAQVHQMLNSWHTDHHFHKSKWGEGWTLSWYTECKVEWGLPLPHDPGKGSHCSGPLRPQPQGARDSHLRRLRGPLWESGRFRAENKSLWTRTAGYLWCNNKWETSHHTWKGDTEVTRESTQFLSHFISHTQTSGSEASYAIHEDLHRGMLK